MRRKSVTGIYVAFNTEDLDQRSPEDTIPALYIRDLDPGFAAAGEKYGSSDGEISCGTGKIHGDFYR